MWLAVGVVLLLLAIGSKVVGFVLCLVLVGVHKAGLLSNIRVGDRTALNVAVHAVHIFVWRNVWNFVRSPTQAPLATISVAGVHLLVMDRSDCADGGCTAGDSKIQNSAHGGDANRKWMELDTSISLKCLDHPIWRSVRWFMHRLSFVWFIVPTISASVTGIEVDVVRASTTGNECIARLQHGYASFQFQFNSKTQEIDVSVRLCRYQDATVTILGSAVEAKLHDIRIKVSVPVSRVVTDVRAPVPSAIHVECGSLSCSVDLATLVKEITETRNSLPTSFVNTPTSTAAQDFKTEFLLPLLSKRLLPLRLAELIPEVSIRFSKWRFSVTSAKSSVLVASVDCVECHLSDPSRTTQLQEGGETFQERRVIVDFGCICVGNDSREDSSRSSSIRLDAVKIEVDSRMETCFVSTDSKPSCEDQDNSVWLDWTSRCSGELRGLRIALAHDLSDWIDQIYTSMPPKCAEPLVESSTDIDDEQVDGTMRQGSAWKDFLVIELVVQLKLLRSEVLCLARDQRCVVLPWGVPDIGLSLDDIVLLAHPFADEESIGVRAKADLQGTRIKLFYVQSARIMRTNFLSIDYIRVLIEPVYVLGSADASAQIDMEAEWLEVRWTSEAMHAIGGMLDLGIFTFQSVLYEHYDWTSDKWWDPRASQKIPDMKTLAQVVDDQTLGSEGIKFRCRVKRSTVLFSHLHQGQNHVDYVTVDTLRLSAEETTGRFRLSILDTKIFQSTQDSLNSKASSAVSVSDQSRKRQRRRPSVVQTIHAEGRRNNNSGQKSGRESDRIEGTQFFSIREFALEENKLPACPMKVLDLLVDGVSCQWDMKTQERVVELIRRITFSSWEMLYRMRSTYGAYCTSQTSRYNRQGGLNGSFEDAAQCVQAEKLLNKLISAGGDTLNRIHATNVNINASIGSRTKQFDLKLHVGVFGSDDLPELWNFEDVQLILDGSLELLAVEQVLVRHTIDKRRDCVFGFFEETLSLRRFACGHRRKRSRSDGMMIEIDGLRIGLSIQFDLVELENAIQAHVAPYAATHMTSFQAPWRPQQDKFYNYFLRFPNTVGQPKVWLQMSNVQVECADNPMEAWLERVYPLWLEELAEQDLRAQLLEEQVTALKLTNADMLVSNEAADEMKALLHEKSSRIYTHKAKMIRENTRKTGSREHETILAVRVGYVEADISFEPSTRSVIEMIRNLDEATPAVDRILTAVGLDSVEYGPRFSMLRHQHLQVTVTDVGVRMRNFLTPVAVIGHVKVGGNVIVGAAQAPVNAVDAFVLTANARCFVDLDIAIQQPVICFGPAYMSTMMELASIADRILPTLILEVDRVNDTAPWDVARRIFHGKLHMNVNNAAIRLLDSSNSSEGGGYFEIGVQSVDMQCRRGENAGTDIQIDRVTVKIEPGALVNIAEITSVTLHSKAIWVAKDEMSTHYILPILYQKYDDTLGSQDVEIDFQAGCIWQSGHMDAGARLKTYAGVRMFTSLSGKIAPKTPSELMTRRDIASRSAIVLYTKHVEWLIHFGRVVQATIQRNFPFRCRLHPSSSQVSAERLPVQCDAQSTSERFLRVFKGVTVEEFEIVGLDIALYHSEKSHVGIRACINDRISLSGSLKVSSLDGTAGTTKTQTTVRNVSFDWGGFTLTLDEVSVTVSDVQVRVCTPSTGSRGESLVSIRDVCLNVGDSKSWARQSHFTFDFAALHSTFDHTQRTETRKEVVGSGSRESTFRTSSVPSHGPDMIADMNRTKSKKTILEHFDIAQHNPYRYRDDNDEVANIPESPNQRKNVTDSQSQSRASSASRIQAVFVEEFRRQGYLLGLSACEIRVLVTLDTVESMVDIIENWVRVVRESYPELYNVPDELLKGKPSPDSTANQALDLGSPKKATSLADDPKFGRIFHASNPLPNNRTPSFNADQPEESNSGISTQLSPTSGAGVVLPFLTVRFMDCQINFQDHDNKGSVLLALSCGSLHHSRSQDILHELIDLKVDGLQLFTAPLDIDVKSRVIWLRTLADGFTYCPISSGLLRQVVAPIPSKVMIWIDRDLSVMNRVDLNIPTVQIAVNSDSKNILENLALSMMGVVTAKLAEYQTPDYSKILQGNHGVQSQEDVRSSLQRLILAKKQLKWKIADLHWRHICRWNYHVSERTNTAIQAVEGVRSKPLELDAIPSPFLHACRLSSSSLVSSMGTSLSLTGSTATLVESASDELQRLQQQHESISEVLRSLVAAELLKRQPNPNIQLSFTLQSASLTLSATNSDIVSAQMTNLKVKLKMYEDQSGTFALTIQGVCCKNLCPHTPYPELLSPHSGSKSWSGDEMFVRVDAEVSPPVGGIKVVRHFEINVHPMQICLSYDLILQLVAFFTSVSGPTQRQEEKNAEVRSQFLSAPHAAGSSEGLLRKAVKVAGKAAHPLTHGLGRLRADSDHDQPIDPRVKAMQALHEEATQWISKIARLDTSKSTPGDDDAAGTNGIDRDLNEMRERANSNIMFKRIRLGTVEVLVSFKNKKSNPAAAAPQQALEDMRGFDVKIHSLVYSDKTCSLMDLLLRIRRDVILDVLSQVGRNFTNVANFLRDQLDITRWGAFDALAPLKSLSTAISGSSQTSSAAPPSPAGISPSPGGMVEMLQRNPRISRDGASQLSAIATAIDTSKVFQLELPDNHPSRRKKQALHTRPTEPASKGDGAFIMGISPLPSPRADCNSGDHSPAEKRKKKLANFFGKSKKAIQTPSTEAAS